MRLRVYVYYSVSFIRPRLAWRFHLMEEGSWWFHMIYRAFSVERFHHYCTHQYVSICLAWCRTRGKKTKTWGTYGRITGRCGCKTGQIRPITKLHLRNGTQTLVSERHALCVLLTNTETELGDNDERSIYLLTDVMNISASPALLPWCITAACLSSLFFHLLFSERIHRFASGAFFILRFIICSD